MNENAHETPFSLMEAVKTVKSKADPDGLYVEGLIATFGARSHAFLILFLSIPFIQPVPTLGLSAPFGFVMMIQGFFLLMDKKPWLPQKLMRQHIRSNLVMSVCNTAMKILSKTEKLIKPRWGWVVQSRGLRILNGMLIAFYAFVLALPIPAPFANSVPAYFLILNALGLLEGDGVVLILSYVVAVLGFVFFLSLGFGALEIFEWLLHKF